MRKRSSARWALPLPWVLWLCGCVGPAVQPTGETLGFRVLSRSAQAAQVSHTVPLGPVSALQPEQQLRLQCARLFGVTVDRIRLTDLQTQDRQAPLPVALRLPDAPMIGMGGGDARQVPVPSHQQSVQDRRVVAVRTLTAQCSPMP